MRVPSVRKLFCMCRGTGSQVPGFVKTVNLPERPPQRCAHHKEETLKCDLGRLRQALSPVLFCVGFAVGVDCPPLILPHILTAVPSIPATPVTPDPLWAAASHALSPTSGISPAHIHTGAPPARQVVGMAEKSAQDNHNPSPKCSVFLRQIRNLIPAPIKIFVRKICFDHHLSQFLLLSQYQKVPTRKDPLFRPQRFSAAWTQQVLLAKHKHP